MKKQLILIFLVIPFFTRAQSDAAPQQGVIRYLLTHNWVKKMEAVDYLSKQQKEKAAYMWGNDSEWKEYTNLYFSGNETKYEESEEKAQDNDYYYSWRKDLFFIKRNFDKNTMTDGAKFDGKNYLIEDSLHCQDWKILNDMKEVAGHICMSASWTDTLKGQKVIAWFALDMPLQAGPEHFCGLPGTILEVNINNGALIVSADKIDMKPISAELELPKKLKAKSVSYAEYQKMLKKLIDEKKKDEEPYFWGMRY
jgi:GLPGLI family protein